MFEIKILCHLFIFVIVIQSINNLEIRINLPGKSKDKPLPQIFNFTTNPTTNPTTNVTTNPNSCVNNSDCGSGKSCISNNCR